MARRLPVYLVLDTSGSMFGQAIAAVDNGVQLLVSTLRQNPHALETAYLSVITFDDTATQVVPLTDLGSFQVPQFDAAGTTALGAALELTAECIQREVVTGSADARGDWKPLVFIMTDGQPTDDDWRSGLAKFQAVRTGTVVACACDSADEGVLKEITNNVVSLATADSQTIGEFFEWVTDSIVTTSQKIEESGNDNGGFDGLPPLPPVVNLV